MTRYLLDTDVISETARRTPDPHVLDWIRRLPVLLLPCIAVYELAVGVRRTHAGKRRQFLEGWFADLLGSQCELLPLDRDAALASAEIDAAARHQRRVVEHRDLLILGTAKARSLGLATRNVAHVRGLGVPIYDPFADAHTL